MFRSGFASVAIVAVMTCSASAFQALTERVSVNSSEHQGNLDSDASGVSADGRFVVFWSVASNLVSGDTNGVADVFMRDRLNGTTERVSVTSGGAQGDSYSVMPSISSDARFVAFHSFASNLVAGDTNGTWDVFVRDRQTGTTERVSVATGGLQGNTSSFSPDMSADGRFVAFESNASNLVAGDTTGYMDVFVRDRLNGTTERVSIATSGAQADLHCDQPSISDDGRFVAFRSFASTLAAGDTNLATDVFVRDRLNGTTERVSIDSSGAQSDAESYRPSISADGRQVAFASAATNLVSGDNNLCPDIFVHDRVSATTVRVSVGPGGIEANSYSDLPAISADGYSVSFDSAATNLVAGDTNSAVDIFVYGLPTGTIERASVDTDGVEASPWSTHSSMSFDGRFVTFQSYSYTLVDNDTNGAPDAFVRERWPLPPHPYCTSGTSSSGCSAIIAAFANPSLSLANACIITVSGVEGLKSGVVFYGIDNTGFAPPPWAAGSTSWLCVKSPQQRTPVQSSGGTFGACDGSYALDWNAYQAANALALGQPWTVGDTIYLQAWFRDPLAVKATNLSNALELTYVP